MLMNMMGLHLWKLIFRGLRHVLKKFILDILKATSSLIVARVAAQLTVQNSNRKSLQSNRQSLLPSSYIARRHLTASNTNTTTKKRRVSRQIGKEKTYTKDIVCLLQQHYPKAVDDRSVIPIPRGKARGSLAELGLIGKVRLVSTWTSVRVTDEITSVFSTLFDQEEDDQLQLKYPSVVPGAKVLSVAKVSSSFSWSGQAVASLAAQGCIYIITQIQLKKTNLNQEAEEEEQNEGSVDAIPINDSDSEFRFKVVSANLYQFNNCYGMGRLAEAKGLVVDKFLTKGIKNIINHQSSYKLIFKHLVIYK